jgi:hypothetical protein
MYWKKNEREADKAKLKRQEKKKKGKKNLRNEDR